MSVNYSEQLSPYPFKGAVGQKEFTETKQTFQQKVQLLTTYFQKYKGSITVHTGAGISTSSGIPDFRGPKGVWTLEKQGKYYTGDTTFDSAIPSYSHFALIILFKKQFIKFLVSQNVDGLHLRSGFPREFMAELHGNMFVLKCKSCGHIKILNKASTLIGQKNSGIKCQNLSKSPPCRGYYYDSVLDWEHDLPEADYLRSHNNAKTSIVNLVLGSSLQILPANKLPLAAKTMRNKKNSSNLNFNKDQAKLVVVNLQRCKFYKRADLNIHSKIDEVMEALCRNLQLHEEIVKLREDYLRDKSSSN